MAAAEPLLVSSLRDLTVRLATPELKGFARQEGFGADVRKWRATLSEVMDLLVDAEEKQNTKAGVKIWLSDLTHLAYDLDDVLDDFEYELLRRTTDKMSCLLIEGSFLQDNGRLKDPNDSKVLDNSRTNESKKIDAGKQLNLTSEGTSPKRIKTLHDFLLLPFVHLP
ncbi:Rx, N-terminal [Dillenia turbinata]|uniref:Rx, N-terminal n=1 Tax=Dillenia turbinata TaxID=194707 RepID=A0AAN8VF41_9MAGN